MLAARQPRGGKARIDAHRISQRNIAYIDGAYVPMSEAKISALDWGFLRSDATYDVVHAIEGRFFRLDRHLARFFASIEKLRMTPPMSPEELTEILRQCVRRSAVGGGLRGDDPD